MALILSSVVLTVVACVLQCPTRADVLVQPGYVQSYAQQTSSNYRPMDNQQQYSPHLRNPGYSSMQYQSTPYQSMPMVSSQYDHESSLDSEFQHYAALNNLIRQKISGIIQNDPNQMSNVDPNLGAPVQRPFLQSGMPSFQEPLSAKFPGGMMLEVTSQGLKPVNDPQIGVYNGMIMGSPQQQGYYQDSQTGEGHRQWTRSVPPTGTDYGDDSSPLPHVQKRDDVAAQSALTETTVTDIPELGSLNESEDKQIECRAIGQADDAIVGSPLQPSQRFDFVNNQHHPTATINGNSDHSINPSTTLGSSPSQLFEQIRPNFSNMEMYNKGTPMLGAVKADTSQVKSGEWKVSDGNANSAQLHHKPQAHPSYSEPSTSSDNWLTNTYQKYYNQAKAALQQGYPLHQGHSGYKDNMNPSNPMYPNQVNSHGGHGSYNQGAHSQGANDENSAFRTAMDYVQKGLNYQPNDWARFGHQWAKTGMSAGLQNPYIQGSSSSSPSLAPSSQSSGLPNGPNSAARTAMNYLQKGLNYQPSDWAEYGNQWAKSGISAPFQNPYIQGRDSGSRNVAPSSPLPGIPHDTKSAVRTAMDWVQKGLNYQPSDWGRFGNQWAKNGISTGLQNRMNNNGMRYF